MSVVCKQLFKIDRLTQKQAYKTRLSLHCGHRNGRKLTINLVAVAKDLNLASLRNALTSTCNVVYVPLAYDRSALCRLCSTLCFKY